MRRGGSTSFCDRLLIPDVAFARSRRKRATPEPAQIEFNDKGIDCPNRVVVTDPVFRPIRKQSALTAIDASAFSHGLGPRRSDGGTAGKIRSWEGRRGNRAKSGHCRLPACFRRQGDRAGGMVPIAA